MENAHKQFTRSERQHAKQLHKQFKKNQPEMFNNQKNSMLKAIVDAKEVNLNIKRVHITPMA